jgi:hypothetical protein
VSHFGAGGPPSAWKRYGNDSPEHEQQLGGAGVLGDKGLRLTSGGSPPKSAPPGDVLGGIKDGRGAFTSLLTDRYFSGQANYIGKIPDFGARHGFPLSWSGEGPFHGNWASADKEGQHLVSKWTVAAALLTHLAKAMPGVGIEDTTSPPQEKPKPKCPTCG